MSVAKNDDEDFGNVAVTADDPDLSLNAATGDKPVSVTHTPGPWELTDDYSPNTYRVEARFEGQRVNVCVPCYGWPDRGMDLANARLIAQSPDLLTELKGFVALYDAGTRALCGQSMRDRLERADAVIAKAEGR